MEAIMGFGILAGIVVIFIGAVMVYGVIMAFWPEWVGITGKTALDYEKSHTEGSTTEKDYDLVDRLQHKGHQS